MKWGWNTRQHSQALSSPLLHLTTSESPGDEPEGWKGGMGGRNTRGGRERLKRAKGGREGRDEKEGKEGRMEMRRNSS